MSEPRFPDDITLGQARQWLRDRIDEGARCPCCTQYAQVYRWSLYSTATAMLIRLYRVGGIESFVESKSVKLPGQGGDATRLRFWGLVEQEPERRQDGGRSGWWRVTDQGRLFVLGAITIPKYAYVFDGRCLRFDGPPVSIRDALGTRFDYSEMMGHG
jgi:hypothetical protein